MRLPKVLAAGFVVLAAAKPCEAMDKELASVVLIAAGLALIALGAALIPKRMARVGAALVVVALASLAVLFFKDNERAADIFPVATAAGVAAIVYARSAAPYAGLAALGQFLVLPLPPIAEVQLDRWAELSLMYHGVIGAAVQLAVGAVAVLALT